MRPKGKSLLKSGFDILLGDGEGEEGGVLRLGTESLFEGGALRRVGKGGTSRLRGCFERVLAGDVLGMGRLAWVEQVNAELLLVAGATLEVKRLGAVELAHNASKHAVESDFSHKLGVHRLNRLNRLR